MIRSIRVSDFRSLRSGQLDPVQRFFALTGPNGGGKSNFLRALNLFFNGQVENGLPIDLARDFHRSEQRREKRVVRVEVGFDLPNSFTFHKGIASKAKQLGLSVRKLTVARTWSRDPETDATVDSFEIDTGAGFKPVAPDLMPVLTTFLTRLLRYRYVPNHVHPGALVESEASNVQREVMTRLRGNSRDQAKGAFDAMAPVARTLMEGAVEEIRAASADLADVILATPKSLAEIPLPLDLALQGKGDVPRNARLHGSGHQSLLAYVLLHLLDTSFSAKFGWHQGTIWGIEEPESFLHEELVYRMSALLRKFTEDPRFQILVTTHSPTVMAFADSGALVEWSNISMLSPPKLIEAASQTRTSPFVHPIIRGAIRPLLLVEGSTDATHIETAYRAHDRVQPWEIRPIEEMGVTGGTSGAEQLIKYHAAPLSARPSDSPVVILLDHEVDASKVASLADRLRAVHPSSAVLQWPATHANPDLEIRTFRGIEAFLMTSALTAAEGDGVIHLLRPKAGKPISASLHNFDKGGLADYLAKRQASSDYSLFLPILEYAESYLTANPKLLA